MIQLATYVKAPIMSEVVKLYIKIFLVMGFGFACSMLLLNFLFGDPNSLFKFLFLFLGFGGFMSLLGVSSHIAFLKKEGVKEFTKETLSVVQQRSVVSSITKQDLVNRIQSDPAMKKMEFHDLDNEIKLISLITWKSFGEVIKIKCRHLQDGLNEFEIISRPRIKFTMLDSGKNLSNVNRVESMIGDVA